MTTGRFGGSTVVLVSLLTLVGCGGGSVETPAAIPNVPAAPLGTSAPPAVPAEPLISFLANRKGAVATSTIGMSASGSFMQGSTRYQVQGGGPSGCAITSDPADESVAACNPLIGGKGFLLCEDILSPHFTATIFPQSDVHLVKHWELAGKTLTGLACGASGPRTTSYTFSFSSDGELATEYAGPITSHYGAGSAEMMEQLTGVAMLGQRQRWVIYKASSGAATQYFLLVIWEVVDPSLFQKPANLYFLQM